MANKKLKSITFPGLPDKYTIPQTAEDLGALSDIVDVESGNLDNIYTSGIYAVNSMLYNPTGLPANGISGTMLVINDGGYVGTQIFFQVDSDPNQIYWRVDCDGSGWYEWQTIGGASGESGHVVATDPNTKGDITISNANMATAIAENNEF